jgi:lysyl-tRNA synthetase class 2
MRVVAIRMLAGLTATLGLIDLAAATAPHHPGRACRHAAAALTGASLARPQALVFGLLLLVLAHGIAGGRRLAQQLAIGGLVLAAIAAMPGRPGRVAVLGALMVGLVALRSEFPTRPDHHRVRLAGQLGLGVLVLVALGGGWGFAVDRDRPRAVGHTLLAAFTAAPPHSRPAELLSVLVITGGVVVLMLMLAAAPAPAPGGAAQRAWVATLAEHADADSLAPFATRLDKAYVFSPDHRAVIGYRVLFGTAMAGGDPVGDAGSADAAIEAFLALCAAHGWRPAVLGAGAPMLPHWHRHRMHGLVVGDEAVLDVASFSLDSRPMRNVRQAVNRSHNGGITATIGPLTAELAGILEPVLADWLGGRAERGFAMNLDRILAPRPDCLVAVARDPAGRPVAFARFAICAGGRILTLDVAPRRHDSPNGVVERLVVEVVDYARRHGATEVSLNFAGLRRLFEADGPLLRTAALAVHAFDRWIELGPLYRFCAKFQPSWRPRSLLMRSWLSIAPVGLAALAAEFGAGGPAEPAAEPLDAPGPATAPTAS